MTPQTAQNHLNDLQSRQRPYLSTLVSKLALTYGVPLGIALVLAMFGAVLLSNFIPSSTATAIVFALNVAVFYYGWNWMEQRTHATGLFMLFVNGSRERRTLASLIQQVQDGNMQAKDDLALQVKRYEEAVNNFIAKV